MRIAYLTFDFGVPVAGTKGASVHVRQMVGALCASGHSVTLLTPSLGGSVPDRPNLRVHELPMARSAAELQVAVEREAIGRGNRLAKDIRNLLYNGWVAAEAAEVLREFAPDVLYERYSLLGTAGLALAARLDIPLILEVNAPLVVEHERERGLCLVETANVAERMLVRDADHLFVVSNWLRDYCVERGAEPGRVTVLANAADPDRFDPRVAGEPVRSRLGWERAFLVGFVGSMKRWHGVDALIDSLRRLDASARLLFVGDGPERVRLERYAAAEGVGDRVHWTGAVPHSEVPRYIAAMDVCVAPLAADAAAYFSPVKLFEYMSMARPVVAAAAGQNSDVVQHGVTGWLYAPGDAAALAEQLTWVQRHATEAAEVAATARRRVLESYTWRRNAECVVEIAQQLLERRRGCFAAPGNIPGGRPDATRRRTIPVSTGQLSPH